MGNEHSSKRNISMPKGWLIQPPLWVDGEGRTFENKGFKFILNGKAIKAEMTNTSLSEEDFLRETSEIVERFIDVYILIKGRFYEAVGLRSKVQLTQVTQPMLKIIEDGKPNYDLRISQGTTATGYSMFVGKEPKEFNDSRNIFEHCETNLTLRGALSYYRLALSGIDQLVTAGNLYMAMEEVFVAVMFRKGLDSWKKVLMELLPYRPESPKSDEAWIDECDKIGDDLQHGRHAWFKPHKGVNKGEWIKSEQLDNKNLVVCNQVVREIILAYVERLKANK